MKYMVKGLYACLDCLLAKMWSGCSASEGVAFSKLGFSPVQIPPRSPDCNPIENLFSLVKRKLRAQALEQAIQRESFTDFQKRVEGLLKEEGAKIANKLVLSMPKRLALILEGKGKRLPY